MIFLIIIVGIIILDQWTKKIAQEKIEYQSSHPILRNTVYITLHKNKGVALNLFEKYPHFIKIITTPMIFLVILYFFKTIKIKGYILTKIAISFIIGGGLGNLIDRIKKGYVIDFFYFNLKRCPIFNFADVFIIVGAILLQILLLFKKTPIE